MDEVIVRVVIECVIGCFDNGFFWVWLEWLMCKEKEYVIVMVSLGSGFY